MGRRECNDVAAIRSDASERSRLAKGPVARFEVAAVGQSRAAVADPDAGQLLAI